MNNQMVLYVAIIIVVCLASGLYLGAFYSEYKASKKNNTVDITMAQVMGMIGELTNKIYEYYEAFRRIDPAAYETDEQYRKKIISTTIDYIIDICAENDIYIKLDKSLLEGVACMIIESIINKYKLQEQEAQIANLNTKIARLDEPVESDATEPNEDFRVSLGDFYKD